MSGGFCLRNDGMDRMQEEVARQLHSAAEEIHSGHNELLEEMHLGHSAELERAQETMQTELMEEREAMRVEVAEVENRLFREKEMLRLEMGARFRLAQAERKRERDELTHGAKRLQSELEHTESERKGERAAMALAVERVQTRIEAIQETQRTEREAWKVASERSIEEASRAVKKGCEKRHAVAMGSAAEEAVVALAAALDSAAAERGRVLKDSGLRAILFRMKHNALGSAFQEWRLGVEEERKEKAEVARSEREAWHSAALQGKATQMKLVEQELGAEQQLSSRLSSELVGLKAALASAEARAEMTSGELEAERGARAEDVERLGAEKRALQAAASGEILKMKGENSEVRRKFVTATRDLLLERKKTAAADKVLDKADDEVSILESQLGAMAVSLEALEGAKQQLQWEKDGEASELSQRLGKVMQAAEEGARANVQMKKQIARGEADRAGLSKEIAEAAKKRTELQQAMTAQAAELRAAAAGLRDARSEMQLLERIEHELDEELQKEREKTAEIAAFKQSKARTEAELAAVSAANARLMGEAKQMKGRYEKEIRRLAKEADGHAERGDEAEQEQKVSVSVFCECCSVSLTLRRLRLWLLVVW